jgi:hypothetical protein
LTARQRSHRQENNQRYARDRRTRHHRCSLTWPWLVSPGGNPDRTSWQMADGCCS